MLFRTWIFMAAVAFVMLSIGDLYPTKLEPPRQIDFDELHKTGKIPTRHLSVDGGTWGEGIIYSKKGSKVKSVTFALVPKAQAASGTEHPEVRILFEAPVPEDTSSEQLDSMVISLLPESVQGCASEINDDETVKALINTGYKVRTPLVRLSPCAGERGSFNDERKAPGPLWNILAVPIILYGAFRFLRLFRACYLGRRMECASAGERLTPSEVSVQETVRAAKVTFSRWKLLRESFIDAVIYYVPRVGLIRLKEGIQGDIARTSSGAIKQLIQAKKEGRLREHLVEISRDRLVAVSNIAALVSVIATLALGEVGGLVVLSFLLLLWLFGAKYLQLGVRKALSTTFLFGVVVGLVMYAIPHWVLTDGVLVRIPFLDEYATVIHPDLLSFPYAVLYSVFSYIVLVYSYRSISLYFRGKLAIELGGRPVEFSDKDT